MFDFAPLPPWFHRSIVPSIISLQPVLSTLSLSSSSSPWIRSVAEEEEEEATAEEEEEEEAIL